MERTFETEVLTRLAVIESKIDDYKSVKERAEQAHDLSTHNKERIEKLEDNNKWIFRTAVGAMIASTVSLVFLFIKLGIGIK